ncbi:carbon monoxide dehydrogenase subunit G [Candidatus Binatus sp.]|uniref:SRPBCC family protein n=1 Tax=Candidatus Binatus sp. TaxID=2811406 RepID=UPI00351CBD34
MKLAGETTLPAPRQRVWELLNDPERLSRLIPGCEKLEILGPDQFAGAINVGIAAVKGTYAGNLKLEEKRPPEHYKMLLDGKGKQGFIRGSGTLDLEAKDPRTTIVKYAGDVQIGGPLMQVGQRLTCGPMMPKHDGWRGCDPVVAVVPRDIQTFRACARKKVRHPRAVIFDRRPLSEPQRPGEGSGLARNFRAARAGLLNVVAASLGFLQQPRRLTQRQPVKDQNGLAAGGAVPEVDDGLRGARHGAFKFAPEFPCGTGKQQFNFADLTLAVGDFLFGMLRGKGGREDFPKPVKYHLPGLLGCGGKNGIERRIAVSRHCVCFSRVSENIPPSGSFLSKSVSCAPVI